MSGHCDRTDEELMELVRARCERGFEALRSRYEPSVRRHLTGMLRDPHAAEDVGLLRK